MAHIKLIRTSALEREERKKAEKRDKKDRDDEEDRLRLIPQFVKNPKPIKHQVNLKLFLLFFLSTYPLNDYTTLDLDFLKWKCLSQSNLILLTIIH
jgi:hypothetical protein